VKSEPDVGFIFIRSLYQHQPNRQRSTTNQPQRELSSAAGV
jgi:hypothetical protein